MDKKSDIFLFGNEQKVEDVGEGIRRQILGYNNELMLVKVWFEEGAVGYVHSHRHSQTSYVESGEFDVNIDGEIKRLSEGDSFFIPPHVSHGAECKKAGVLLDFFSPVREDFLEEY